MVLIPAANEIVVQRGTSDESHMQALIRTTLSLLFALSAASPVLAQVYQWKDANGRTIISDTPPPSSAKVRKFSGDKSAPGTSTKEGSGKSLAEQEIEFRKRQLEQQDKAAQSAREQEQAEGRKRACADVRRQLGVLQSGERIALRDDKGERYFMEDAQRADEIRRAQGFLDSNCKGM